MDFNDLQTRVQEVLANPSFDDLADVDFELGEFLLDNQGSPDAIKAEQLLKQVQTLDTQLTLGKQADEARYKGKWDKAIDLYDEILRIDPNNVDAKEGRDKAVVAKFRGDQVFEGLPSAVKDPFQQAQSRERMGLYREAQMLYEQARQQALAHGIERWNDLEERFRIIDEALLAQKQVEKAEELVKEDKWEEALRLLRNVAKVMGTDEYVEKLKKVQHLKETHDEARQVLRTVERRLRQAAGQSAMIDLIVNDLENVEAKLGEVLKDYQQSRQLNQLYKELQERIVVITEDRQKRQSKKIRHLVMEGQRLISEAQSANNIKRKKDLLQEAINILEEIQSDESDVREIVMPMQGSNYRNCVFLIF